MQICLLLQAVRQDGKRRFKWRVAKIIQSRFAPGRGAQIFGLQKPKSPAHGISQRSPSGSARFQFVFHTLLLVDFKFIACLPTAACLELSSPLFIRF
jgi:hypothetical protein